MALFLVRNCVVFTLCTQGRVTVCLRIPLSIYPRHNADFTRYNVTFKNFTRHILQVGICWAKCPVQLPLWLDTLEGGVSIDIQSGQGFVPNPCVHDDRFLFQNSPGIISILLGYALVYSQALLLA